MTFQEAPGLARSELSTVHLRHLSPFRYPGGKTWLLPTVRGWLSGLERPSHLLEPFAGGGTVGLTVAAEGLAGRVTLVELDDDVAAVWQVLLDGSDRDVAALVAMTLEFVVTFENVRAIIDASPVSSVSRAFRTITKNRFQRGGVMARRAGLMREAGEGRGLAGRWYPETLVRRFMVIRNLREKVAFEHRDGLEAIGHHRGATMFIDPPYTAGSGKCPGSRLYAHHELDHARLFDLVAASPGPALFTYDNAPEVRQMALTHGFKVGEVTMRSAKHIKMRELTIWKD